VLWLVQHMYVHTIIAVKPSFIGTCDLVWRDQLLHVTVHVPFNSTLLAAARW
jgi:hypothetical protein